MPKEGYVYDVHYDAFKNLFFSEWNSFAILKSAFCSCSWVHLFVDKKLGWMTLVYWCKSEKRFFFIAKRKC